MLSLFANVPINLDWIQLTVTVITTLFSVCGAFIFFNTKLIGAMHKNLITRISNLETNDIQKTEELNRLYNELNIEKIEKQKLFVKIELIESAHFDMPLPMWLKDTNGNVLYANPKYEEVFLTPRGYSLSDYIGKDDLSVWPQDIALKFKQHDQNVLASGNPFDGYEMIHSVQGNKWWRIIKYVRKVGNIKIGIAGIAIPFIPIPESINKTQLGIHEI